MEKFLEILHVGGRSDVGMSAVLWDKIKNEANLTLFEADHTLVDAGLTKENAVGIKIISKCLSNYIGQAEFNLNVDICSSSLFKTSPKAIDNRWPSRWGDMSKTIKTIKVNVTTLNQLLKDNEIVLPHFMGLDAQGSEYNIMLAGTEVFEKDLVGIISEMEFREIYEGQALFADQDSFLRKYCFNLHDFYSGQYWSYVQYFKGTGFPVVTEAFYLRDFEYFVNRDEELNKKLMNLARLIVVAVAYTKFCYAHVILKYIKTTWLNEWNNFLNSSSYECLKNAVKTIEDIAIADNLI